MDFVGLYEQLVILLLNLSFKALKLLAQGLFFLVVKIAEQIPPFIGWLKRTIISLGKLFFWIVSTQLIPGAFFITFLTIKGLIGLVKFATGFMKPIDRKQEAVAEAPAIEVEPAIEQTVYELPTSEPALEAQPIQAAQPAVSMHSRIDLTPLVSAGNSAVELSKTVGKQAGWLTTLLLSLSGRLLKAFGLGAFAAGKTTLKTTGVVSQHVGVGLDQLRVNVVQPGLVSIGEGSVSAASMGATGSFLFLKYVVILLFQVLKFIGLGLALTVSFVFKLLITVLPKIAQFAVFGVQGLASLTLLTTIFISQFVGFIGWALIAGITIALNTFTATLTLTAKLLLTAVSLTLFGVGSLGKGIIQVTRLISQLSERFVRSSAKHSHRLAVHTGLPLLSQLHSRTILALSALMLLVTSGTAKSLQLVSTLLGAAGLLAKKLEQIRLPKLQISIDLPKLPSIGRPHVELPSLPQLPTFTLPKIELPKVNFAQTFKNIQDLKPVKTEPILTEVYTIQEPKPVKRAGKSTRFVWISRLALSGIVLSLFSLALFMFPDLFYRLVPFQGESVVSAVDQSKLGPPQVDLSKYAVVKLPPQDESLPKGQWLRIPKIGVETQIQEHSSTNYEEALRNGVWRVPEFGNPTTSVNYPMIMVAHRFGYLSWSTEFRKKNSFYNLDKLNVGDTFEVIWDQRKFTYEVYAGEVGKDVTDYSADVVLYTCKYLNAQIRILRYAKRVEI